VVDVGKHGIEARLPLAQGWRRTPPANHRRIIDVTERDCVIEGLPPSREETRRGIAEQRMAIDRNPPARLPAE